MATDLLASAERSRPQHGFRCRPPSLHEDGGLAHRDLSLLEWSCGAAPRTNERLKRRRIIPKEEAIELEGTVEQNLGNGNYRISVSEHHSVLAQVAGKMRKYRIRVLPGDRVTLEVSPYDLNRGRITYRHRN